MKKSILWMQDNWPSAAPFLAVFSLVILLAFRPYLDTAIFLIWLQTPIYLLHQSEEYIFPGGFLKYFNNEVLGSKQDAFPLTKPAAFWINVPVIFVAFPASAILAMHFGVSFGLWAAYFSIINAASHVGMFFKNGYNPGFVVSAVLNIPVGLFTIGFIMANDLASLQAHVIAVLIASGIQVGLMIYGFLVLKPRIKD